MVLNKVRQLFVLLTGSLFILGSSELAVASHSMGSDITYRCLGPNQYEVTLSFYRDCAGVPADGSATIQYSSSCFPAGFEVLQLIPGTGQEITPLCPSQVSTCNGGLYTGIQEYIYRGIITLPGPCADWTFSYNLCCRNAAITNIDFPASTQIYVFASLNNLITPCNNSPTFSNKPVPFVCRGQQYCYNHGAFDPDGDSLVYSLITPFDSPGFIVSYNGTFSPNQPLTSVPAMTFDQSTGDFCMTPSNLEVTVMAVLVQEYRNGVLIGSVERDIQITVIDCVNQLPTLSGINGTNSFSTSVCAGSQLCFNINSADVNATQNTTVSWDGAIPDATFTIIPGNRESASFCWTPSAADISSNPYCFTVLVQDDNCPFLGSQIYSYCITVRGLIVNAGPDVSVGCNSNVTINASASSGNGGYTYAWNNGMTGSSISVGPGTYIVTASDGTCTAKDTVNVSAGPNSPTAAFTMISNCTSLDVQFNNQSSIAGGTISGYVWNFGDGNSSTTASPTHTYSSVGNYQVMLITTAVGGCIDTTIQTLNLVNDQPVAIFNLADACLGSQVNFTDNSTSNSAITSWTWNFGDQNTSNVPSPAHTYTNTGTYQVKLLIINANGCRDSIIQPVNVFAVPVANAGADRVLCEGTSINITGSGGGTGTYLWNPGTQTTAVISVSPAQTISYILTVSNADGCTDTDTVLVTVNPTPLVNPMPDESICTGSGVTLSASGGGPGGGGITYLWNPGGTTNRQLTVTPIVNSSYTVTLTNSNGCSSKDTVDVSVNALPVLNTSSTNISCFGLNNGTANVTVSSGTAPYTYSWSNGGGTIANAVGLSNGTYDVIVTDDNGCTQAASVMINEPAAINLVPSSSPASCFGSSDGSASVIATGGTPGYTYAWSPGAASSSSISGLPAGNYNVTVTDSNSCTHSIVIAVGEPTAINPVPATIPVQCFGLNNGSASVATSGGTPGYSYTWSGGSSTISNITGLIAGNYSVTVSDANGCTATAPFQITEPTALVLNSSSTPAACSTVGNGTASVVVSGGVTAYSYAWSPSGGTMANASGLVSGSYSVVVTDANGCTSSISANVGSIGGPVINPLTINNVTCNGGNTGSASVSISAGTGPYSINWLPTGGNNSTATNLSAGNYTVNVIDANGCPATHQLNISEPSAIVSQVSNTSVSCFGGNNGTATVVVNGGTPGYTYLWNNGAGTNANSTGLLAGNYSVTVRDNNGCTQISNVTVSQPTSLNLVTSSTPAQCNGLSNGSVRVVVSGGTPGYAYNWSSGSGTVDNVSGLAAGNYSVIVTDANSCTSTANVSVTQPTAIQLAISSTPASCSTVGDGSASILASGGIPGYSYAWSPFGGTSPTATGLTPGLYTSIVTDANGCTKTVTVNVNSVGGPTMSSSTPTNVSCFGGSDGSASVNIVAGTPPYTIAWLPSGGNGTQATNLSAGLYTVSVTDDNGCSSTHQITITQPSALYSSASSTNIPCYGMNNGTIDVNTSGGTPPYTYMWNPGGIGPKNISNLAAGSYSVLVTDANGCSKTASSTINQPPALVPTINSSTLNCKGDTDATASVSISGGIPGYQYLWSPTGATTSTINGLGHGNYSVTIVDANGCSIVVSTSIIDPPGMSLTLQGAKTICIGQTATLTAVASGGTRPYSYTWNNGQTDSVRIVNPVTNTTYSVSVTDMNGCPASAQPIVVQVHPPLQVIASPELTICQGDQANVSALASGGNGGPYSYSWNQGAIQVGSSPVYPVNDSTFIVTAIDACGTPAAVDSVRINVSPLPQVKFLPHKIEGCTPVNAFFNNYTIAEAGSNYYWNLGDHTTSTELEPSHEYLLPGTYDVSLTVVSPSGCTDKLNLQQVVTVFGYPVAAFSQSFEEITVLNPGIAFFDESVDATYWEWDFGDGTSFSNEQNPFHEYADSGTYTVRLIVHSDGGCQDTIYSTVKVEMEFIINVPNAFTPNGDGKNDGFIAYGIGYTDYDMWILDRWGKKIYHSTDKKIPWDGTFFGNGEQCQADVYEWVLDVLDFKGKKHRLIGHVTLYR